MDLRLPSRSQRCRRRGRPKHSTPLGPTPELLRRKQANNQQWNLSHDQILAKGWWHLFYAYQDISFSEFILSQDLALLCHWSYRMNNDHTSWFSPLALERNSRSRELSEDDQDLISRWWHQLIQTPYLKSTWPSLNRIYATPIPETYQRKLYSHFLTEGRQGIKKIATHWVSRRDFLDLRNRVMETD